MLKEGDKVIIGSKYAKVGSYDCIVGRKGIISSNEIFQYQNGESTRQVIVGEGNFMNAGWYVRTEDCIPADTNTNAKAQFFLDDEY